MMKIFKAKRKRWKELPEEDQWVEGYVTPCVVVGKWHVCRIEENLSTTQIEIDPETICQCTGMTDNNGELIWENDIVRRTDIHLAEEPDTGVIWYDIDNTSFLIKWISPIKYSATYPWKGRLEVIGNVFSGVELPQGGIKR